MRNVIICLTVLVLVGIGFWALREPIEPPVAVFTSQAECEQAVGGPCSYQMCDVVPAGQTYEETCGKDFKKGWVAAK